MLAIKKPAARFPRRFPALILTVLAPALFSGCGDPGSRALLQGERLLRERRFSEAIEKLQQATRLMPREARAWNHLGLAQHGAGHATEAARAYQQALTLNRNLTAAHYNLGCLHLEQNNLPSALAELTSYTALQANAAEGWTRLGTAQWRAHQPDAAEKSFRQSLKISTRSAEAWNGLGLIQVQRRRYQDAYQQFAAALRVEPDYGPALLNAAIVAQQYLNSRPLALQKYRDYLALQPQPSAAAGVQQMVRQLEMESQPAARPSPTNPPPQFASLAPTGAVASAKPTQGGEISGRSAAAPAAAPAGAGQAAAAAPSNSPAQSNPVNPPVAAEKSATNASPPAALPGRVHSGTASPPTNAAGSTRVTAATSPPPTAVELVRLADEEPVRPARDLPADSRRAADPPASVPAGPRPSANAAPAGNAGSDKSKAGFASRLNPVNWFRSKPQSTDPPDRAAVAVPETNRTVTVARAAPSTSAPRDAWPRYRYQSPPPPAPGNRAEAERHLAEGVRAQERSRLDEAVAAYRQAIRADPSFFDAHYNLGVASQQSGDLSQCLSAYESALAIQPDSVKARFNFAVALQKAGYPRDAANELEKVLAGNPAEGRAHFALANLAAQQLGEPARAREHYLRVLQLEPQHPQATAIRYWLEANP